MDISIIIPVYNSKKTIRECILSIMSSDFEKTYEIMVVDDGSTDGSIDKISDLDVIIIKQKNSGAAVAKNKGARKSRSKLILFVDSDVVLYKDTLQRVYDHLKKKDVDYLSVRYSLNPVNKKWIHKYKALADFFYYYQSIFTKKQRKGPIKNIILNGGAEGYKKDVFLKLGGYDENIKGADVEREKLFSQLTKGYNILADGNIKTRHNFPEFKQLIKNYYLRTLHSIELMSKYRYDQPYLESNKNKIMIGALTIFTLLFSIVISIIFSNIFIFFLPLIIFIYYLKLHDEMFKLAFKREGMLFMLYSLFINLLSCSVVSIAGTIGLIRCKIK